MMNGMLALSVGSLLPFIRDAGGLDYGFCGMLVSLHSVGNLLSSFLAGALAFRLGRKRSILIFNAFYAIAYLLILLCGNEVCLILAFTLTGMTRGATSNFCNMTVNNLAPGQAWILNGLHAMFSVGAFLFPVFLTLLTAGASDRWWIACCAMLIMGILSWILYRVMPVDEILRPEEGKERKKSAKGRKESTMSFMKEPVFVLCTATLFFYLCVEQGVIGWLVTYFKDTGLLNASWSQIMAGVQWLMILAGRLTTAWLSTRMDKTKLLRIMGAGLVLFFILLITGRSTLQIVIGIMGFGYSMAGIYPTTVSFAGKLIQKSPMSWSFILTLASFGSILMPSIIGRIAEKAGIFYGMSSIVVVIVIDMILIIGLTGYMKRKSC